MSWQAGSVTAMRMSALGVICLLVLACAGSSPPRQSGTSGTSGTSDASGTSPLSLYANSLPASKPVGAVTTHTVITDDGRTRSYRLFVPAQLPTPAPLLVALHGGLGSGAQFERSSGFDALATANGGIVAYPDGVGRAADGSGGARTWNGGRCCGAAAAQEVDDVAFLRLLVADIERTHAVDPHRVYATGHSNGGIMALRLACEAADLFVAVGVQSAALEIPDCAPSTPVSVLQIHGTADTNIPIEGGRGSGLAGVAFSPPRQAAETFAARQACSLDPTVTTWAEHPDVRLTQWAGCAGTASVSFIEVAGAAHAWMGQPPHPDLDASSAIWSFLTGHPR